MKKVYCREIELFTTVVLELLEQNEIVYPDEDTPHTPARLVHEFPRS